MLFIPLISTESNYERIVTLNGVDFILRFFWNDRAGGWFLTIRDSAGNDLITAQRLVAHYPFAYHATIEGTPAGQLWVVDSDGKGDPGLRDLGIRVHLMYEEAGS